MSLGEFEVVGIERFREEVEKARKRIKEMMDSVAALEEAARISEYLIEKGYKIQPVEVEEGLPPIFRVDLNKKIAIYIIVYPPRFDLLAGEASKPATYLLFGPPADEAKGRYTVLVYFSRKGKLGPAAYLYLGMLIEEYGIGVLFVNGSEEEIVDIIESLRKSGRYEPPEEEAVPLS